MSEENKKEINKNKMNQIKAFFNPNDSNIKKPIFKKNKFLIEANIKQKIDENIKYNLNEITKKKWIKVKQIAKTKQNMMKNQKKLMRTYQKLI